MREATFVQSFAISTAQHGKAQRRKISQQGAALRSELHGRHTHSLLRLAPGRTCHAQTGSTAPRCRGAAQRKSCTPWLGPGERSVRSWGRAGASTLQNGCKRCAATAAHACSTWAKSVSQNSAAGGWRRGSSNICAGRSPEEKGGHEYGVAAGQIARPVCARLLARVVARQHGLRVALHRVVCGGVMPGLSAAEQWVQGGPRSEGAEPLAVLHPDTRSEGAPVTTQQKHKVQRATARWRGSILGRLARLQEAPPGGVAAKPELQRAAALMSRCAATRPATASAQQRPRLASRAAIAS